MVKLRTKTCKFIVEDPDGFFFIIFQLHYLFYIVWYKFGDFF